MLFLPALLFFVLGTGTSVLAVGSESSDPFMGVAITSERDSGGSGMDKEMDYKRAQGYWRLEEETNVGHPLVAYVGEGDPLVLYPRDREDINVAWNGMRNFVRIMNPREYREHIRESYPQRRNGDFLKIPIGYKLDKLQIQLFKSQGRIHGDMAILAQPIVFMSKMLSVNYGAGMPRNRGHGVWKPIEINNVQPLVLVDIGTSGKMELSYETVGDRDAVDRRRRYFMRIPTKEDYLLFTGKEYEGVFPAIPKDDYKRADRITLYLYTSMQEVGVNLVVDGNPAAEPAHRV